MKNIFRRAKPQFRRIDVLNKLPKAKRRLIGQIRKIMNGKEFNDYKGDTAWANDVGVKAKILELKKPLAELTTLKQNAGERDNNLDVINALIGILDRGDLIGAQHDLLVGLDAVVKSEGASIRRLKEEGRKRSWRSIVNKILIFGQGLGSLSGGVSAADLARKAAVAGGAIAVEAKAELIGLTEQNRMLSSVQAWAIEHIGGSNIPAEMKAELIELVKQNRISYMQALVIKIIAANSNISAEQKAELIGLIIQNRLSNGQAWFIHHIANSDMSAEIKAELIELVKQNRLFDVQSSPILYIAESNISTEIKVDIIRKLIFMTPAKVDHVSDIGTPATFYTLVYGLNNLFIEMEGRFDAKTVNNTISILANEYIRYVNELHNDSQELRKRPIEQATPRTLYILLSKGGELHTSSYRDVIFPIFLQRLHGRSIRDYAREVDPDMEYYGRFLNGLATFNLIEHVLPDESDINMQRVFYRDMIEKFKSIGSDLDAALFLAPFVDAITRLDTGHKRVFLQMLAEEYRNLSPYKKEVLGIILANNIDILRTISVEKNLLKELQRFTNLSTRIPKYEGCFRTNFYNQTRHMYVKQYFYSDEDGIGSFNSFVAYMNARGYKPFLVNAGGAEIPTTSRIGHYFVKNNGNRVVFKKQINGTIVAFELEIYNANHENSIKDALEGEKYLIIIHRGHSYHLNNTFSYSERYNLSCRKILGIGSCGGYGSVGSIYKSVSGQVDFFATQGTGTMAINNPLILAIAENIARSRGSITWEELHNRLKPIYESDPRGKDYFDPSSINMQVLSYLAHQGIRE